MKKLLLIGLLIVGCDYDPTEHTHETTGTLFLGTIVLKGLGAG